MTPRKNTGRIAAEDRSAIPSVRGCAGWTAVLLAIACSLTGVAFDSGDGELGITFDIAYVIGCLAAIVLVARRSLFAPAVQPPILLTAIVPLVYMIAGTGGKTGFFSRTQIISAGLPLVESFPLMIGTTLAVVAIALLRGMVLEPKSTRRRFRSLRSR